MSLFFFTVFAASPNTREALRRSSKDYHFEAAASTASTASGLADDATLIGSEDKNEVDYEAIDVLEEEDTTKSKME